MILLQKIVAKLQNNTLIIANNRKNAWMLGGYCVSLQII